ncbi:MAG: Uma2 family endonuclease [Candidatus Competibacteraceae bacterium]|nr:Uma2 family endonuclease [Candidatus Competibacteraceae bacterium]MCP5126087.1 Uma2 family endonuclease [Gammaproteobacteria bacterium]HRX72297.1 Uma2 family endonuclease [Candidatus Competibacteraceae bacterium]
MQAAAKILPDVSDADAFLAWENQQDTRHEWIDGRIVAMTGGTFAHARLIVALAARLYHHLRGTPCTVLTSDFKVQAAQDVFYPDVVVTCDPQDDQDLICKNPKLIIEVLSNSTAQKDRQNKRLAYQQMASLEEYVLVAQEVRHIEVYRRAEQWQRVILIGGAVELRSVDFSLDLDELYI